MTKLEPVRRAPSHQGPRRWWTNRAAVAGAFVVVLGVVGAVVFWPGGDDPGDDVVATTTTTVTPDPTAAPTTEATTVPPRPAVDVAQAFTLPENGAAAVELLADDAELVEFPWTREELAAAIDWQLSFTEDMLVSCDETEPALVVCQYTIQSPMGRAVVNDPIVSTYEFEITDGFITKVTNVFNGLGGWDTFADFMLGHPDFDRMFVNRNRAVHSADSNELWREHQARFLANRFYFAYTSGNFDDARFMGRPNLLDPGLESIVKAFGTEVSDVACESETAGIRVRCTTTQTDDFTRYISDYTYWHEGLITISNGRVWDMQNDLDDPVFDGYLVWLDGEKPGSWETEFCGGNGWAQRVACVALILDPANIDAWLATDPDLSSIGL